MRKVAIIGAGPAGIEAASVLAKNGIEVTLFEKSETPLKNIQDKAFLFPNFQAAQEIADDLSGKLLTDGITAAFGVDIADIKWQGTEWKLIDAKGQTYVADAVLVATGYQVFDAHRKEELGYGIYKGVITSLDMEQMIKHGKILNANGDEPKRITFLQCVGSRDEKSGNNYCSKICCVTAVKQAIEVCKQLRGCEASIFYMDLRMWGQGFEEMYRMAQEKYGISFVRGRISEAAATFDGRVQLKSEDTLMGLPLKMTTDLLVLMVGMEASCGTKALGQACGTNGEYGFIKTISPHLYDNETGKPGLFAAGTCKRPMSIWDSVNDARAAAIAIKDYIDTLPQQ
ncbi:MAG: CoB--CoM heterodisulfide reductase iron-sulfur subunit A family protein [Bacteroidaceae bacterium]|nr:CoB--CoM heterodisulfide reductase iron-sulfur subunit A family protein [Bacteroidaceae bacterium]